MIQDYVVMDIETTGLNPRTDKIIELGAAKVRNGEVIGTFSQYINPGRSLPSRIVELTGIRDVDLQDAPYIEEVMDEFMTFVSDDILLGHNLIFDYSFVKKAAVNQKKTFDKKGIDTLRIARRFLTELESRRLGYLCEYYQIELSAHRALNDALATHELYQRMGKDFFEKEADTFLPQALIYSVKKEGPITPRQKDHLLRLAERYMIMVEEGHFLQPDGKVILDVLDIERMTKNEASRLIDHLLSNYGR